jgi:hypothetical protein
MGTGLTILSLSLFGSTTFGKAAIKSACSPTKEVRQHKSMHVSMCTFRVTLRRISKYVNVFSICRCFSMISTPHQICEGFVTFLHNDIICQACPILDAQLNLCPHIQVMPMISSISLCSTSCVRKSRDFRQSSNCVSIFNRGTVTADAGRLDWLVRTGTKACCGEGQR